MEGGAAPSSEVLSINALADARMSLSLTLVREAFPTARTPPIISVTLAPKSSLSVL